MQKIAVFNLNVGSAIEYAGNILISWLEELDYEIATYTIQTEAGDAMRFLDEYCPDLIVINEDHHRPIVATYLYRATHDVRVIFIDHVWRRIDWAFERSPHEYEAISQMWYMHILDAADHIFCLNSKPIEIPWHPRVAGKMSNRYYPTDPSVYSMQKPWADRSKMFCYIGNILPHKLSNDFMAKVCETDLVVDCYGSYKDTGSRYDVVFKRAQEAGNIVYHGLIPQDKIAEVMNEYKYFVLPHAGYEPFNWVLKQCMYCGTIPLVTNDRNSPLYNGKWLDWAAGMYMGCKYTDDLVNNLEKMVAEQPDHSEMSEIISKVAMTMFPYQEFKDEFKNKAKELLDG